MENLWTDDSDPALDRQVEQLALDAQFRAWVLSPTTESEAHWTDYQSLYPDRTDAIRQARTLVVALQMPDYALSEEAITSRTERLLYRIRTGQVAERPIIVRSLNSQIWRWSAAAVVVLSLGWLGYYTLDQRLSAVAVRQEIGRPRLPTDVAGTVTEEATGNIERRITLPDGSVVTLTPHSYLRYAHPFGRTDRTVALTGQAFFNVTRNPKKPFFVYTDAVVTRVLGTSFTVRNRVGQPATVIVRTGRVSVYSRRTFKSDGKMAKGLVLTPNQQATIRSGDGLLARSLVDKPLPLPGEATLAIDFENRPISEVIDALIKMYGVPIDYDHERLSRCSVTVKLVKEPLFDQLALLSKLVDGHYEVVDATIHLYADGCK